MALAARLRKDGVDAVIDRWSVVPGDHLPEFMERAIRENDYVLVICTPTYKEKSDKRLGGVGYEGTIIFGDVLTQHNHRKFIPVLRHGEWTSSAPTAMVGKVYVDLRESPFSETQYQYLLRSLYRQPDPPPPLGPPLVSFSSDHADLEDGKSPDPTPRNRRESQFRETSLWIKVFTRLRKGWPTVWLSVTLLIAALILSFLAKGSTLLPGKHPDLAPVSPLSWYVLKNPSSDDSTSRFTDAWGTSSQDVWFLMLNNMTSSTLLRYYTGRPTVVRFPERLHINNIWGGASYPLYLAAGVPGDTNQKTPRDTAMLLRFDGHVWDRVILPDSTTSVWLLGGESEADFYAQTWKEGYDLPYTLHFLNGIWKEMSFPPREHPVLTTVWAMSEGDVVAGGELNGNPVLYHREDYAWVRMILPGTIREGTVNDVWGTSRSDLFAVGRFNPGWGFILHYDGRQWNPTSIPAGTPELYGVWGTSPNDVYAIGRRGTVLRFDGTQWSPLHTPTVSDLLTIWGQWGADTAFIGGGNGGILTSAPISPSPLTPTTEHPAVSNLGT